MTMPRRRTWWLLGRTVPGVVATMLGYCSFSAAMIDMALRTIKDGERIAGFSIVVIWMFAVLLLLYLICAVATITALRRYPELVRWPTNPLPPDRTRMWWFVGSALALIGVLGLILVAAGAGAALWWGPFVAAIAGQWVFLMLANRTGQRAPAATNAPPTIT